MGNKQTAVEWLMEQVDNLDWRNLQGDKKLEIFEQAKAMEREQIEEHLQEELMDATNYIETLLQQKQDITQIVSSEPNDVELGKKIRRIYG